MTKNKPAALMSYVHSDDRYEQLSTLRDRLSIEVQMQIGVEFPIFQDKKDIHWGQNWEERIESALTEEITFLIPIISPSYFNSQPCRDELERFLDVETKLKRRDLILPIYFVDTRLLNDAELRSTDHLAELIASRQYADWRHLRFEPFTNPLVGKTLEQLATQIRDALPIIQTTKRVSAKTHAEPAATTSEQRPESRITKTEPLTCVVDPQHGGDFTSIAKAISEVQPGTRILVRKGVYKERLVIDKPLEIIGDGEAKDIVIQATGADVIMFQASMGRLANLTLQQLGGSSEGYCVDIAQGRLELEDCDITSQSLACVAIHSGADPRLRRNHIHESKTGSGIYVYENAQGTIEDNDIFNNVLSGVEINTSSNPTLRRNRIHDGKQGGVFINEGGQGILEDNEIFANAHSGVNISTDANPTLRRNRIRDNKQCGVYVFERGQGILEDNDVLDNGFSGIYSRDRSNPILKNNRINKNSRFGIEVFENGGGTFENNDVTKNSRGAWSISADSEANVTRTNNKE
jgi:F-box protein 11